MEIEVLVRSLSDAFGTGVWVYRRDPMTRRMEVLKSEGPFTWEEHKLGELMPRPLFSTESSESEIIFDKFIEAVKTAGYGKDRISVESGELKATKEHLKDMQRLVFDFGRAMAIPDYHVAHLERPWVSRREEEVKVKSRRVRRAAKQCSNARGILAELFPELFGAGWENEAD